MGFRFQISQIFLVLVTRHDSHSKFFINSHHIVIEVIEKQIRVRRKPWLLNCLCYVVRQRRVISLARQFISERIVVVNYSNSYADHG